MRRSVIFTTLLLATMSAASSQTLTRTYIELADSADNYMKRERWEDAERMIVGALRHEPANRSNWLLWSNLGVVRTHRDNYPGALEAYEIGLSGAPRSTVLLSNRAWTHLSFDHPEEAMADLDRTLSLDSLQAWPLKMRGLLTMTSTPDKALRDLRRSDSIASGDAAVKGAIADILAARGQTADAVDYYEASLKLAPDDMVSYKLLLILTDTGNSSDTQDRTINALAKWPENPGLHLVRALQHKKNLQTDACERERLRALSLGADPVLVNQILGNPPRRQ